MWQLKSKQGKKGNKIFFNTNYKRFFNGSEGKMKIFSFHVKSKRSILIAHVFIVLVGMHTNSVYANQYSINSRSMMNSEFLRKVDGIISSGKMKESMKYKNYPLLHLVAKSGYESQLKGLIKIGADVNVLNSHGQNVIHVLASKHDRTNIIDILINAGANVNLQRKIGNVTPLMTSVIRGVDNNVKLLLAKGANINIRSRTNDTALSYAVRENRPDIIKLILVNKNLSLDTYDDAINIAIRLKNYEILDLLAKNKLFKLKPIVVMKMINNGFRIKLSKLISLNEINLCDTAKIKYQRKEIMLLDAIVKYNRVGYFTDLIKSSDINLCLDKSLLYSIAEGNLRAVELLYSERLKNKKSNDKFNQNLFCNAVFSNNFHVVDFLKRQWVAEFSCKQ